MNSAVCLSSNWSLVTPTISSNFFHSGVILSLCMCARQRERISIDCVLLCVCAGGLLLTYIKSTSLWVKSDMSKVPAWEKGGNE